MRRHRRQRAVSILLLAALAGILCTAASRATADSQTALMNRVNAAFRANRQLNGAYCYTVAPGVVVLHGTVFDRADRDLAESTARQVRGVRQVINSLLTTTGDWREEQARINDTLALNGFPDLTVRVVGPQAFLSGTVVGPSEQQRALRVIASVSNLQVVNFSRVLPGSVF